MSIGATEELKISKFGHNNPFPEKGKNKPDFRKGIYMGQANNLAVALNITMQGLIFCKQPVLWQYFDECCH